MPSYAHRRSLACVIGIHLPMSSALGVVIMLQVTGHAGGVPIATLERGRSVEFPSEGNRSSQNSNFVCSKKKNGVERYEGEKITMKSCLVMLIIKLIPTKSKHTYTKKDPVVSQPPKHKSKVLKSVT